MIFAQILTIKYERLYFHARAVMTFSKKSHQHPASKPISSAILLISVLPLIRDMAQV
jgi:hypothetical protein